MGIAGLVLGIVAIVFGIFAPYLGWIGLILGIVGIVLAALARKQEKKGINTAGLVVSIVGTCICCALWIALALLVNTASTLVTSALLS